MKKQKLLSIIIPIYNSETYLKECIESVLISRREEIEVILINDGSVDSSAQICDMITQKDNRVKFINQKNMGVSYTRNCGINLSQAKYVMFVDSDDLLDSNWDSILDFLEEDDLYYFSSNIKRNSSKNEMVKYIVGNNKDRICYAGPFSKVFKKDFLKKNDIEFNLNLINGEDMLFNLRCIIALEKFQVINFSFYLYRNSFGSATKRFDERIFYSDINFHRILEKLLSNSFLSDNEISNTLLYCKQRAIFMLCQRISFIDSYRNAKKYYRFIESEPYNDAMNKQIIVDNKYLMFLVLLKYKMFVLCYSVLKLKNCLLMRKEKKYYFSEI